MLGAPLVLGEDVDRDCRGQGARAGTTPPDALWLSITHYGERYGVDRKTVRKWIAFGYCDIFRVDRTIRVRNQPPRATPRLRRRQSGLVTRRTNRVTVEVDFDRGGADDSVTAKRNGGRRETADRHTSFGKVCR